MQIGFAVLVCFLVLAPVIFVDAAKLLAMMGESRQRMSYFSLFDTASGKLLKPQMSITSPLDMFFVGVPDSKANVVNLFSYIANPNQQGVEVAFKFDAKRFVKVSPFVNLTAFQNVLNFATYNGELYSAFGDPSGYPIFGKIDLRTGKVTTVMSVPLKNRYSFPQGAMIAINPKTGDLYYQSVSSLFTDLQIDVVNLVTGVQGPSMKYQCGSPGGSGMNLGAFFFGPTGDLLGVTAVGTLVSIDVKTGACNSILNATCVPGSQETVIIDPTYDPKSKGIYGIASTVSGTQRTCIVSIDVSTKNYKATASPVLSSEVLGIPYGVVSFS